MYRCCSLYCVLSAGFLSCYFTPEEIDAKVQPTLNVPVNKVRLHPSLYVPHSHLHLVLSCTVELID